jgi:hypothetical protein
MNRHCLACEDELISPVYRTDREECFVFQGLPGDFRNGIKFHTKAGVPLRPVGDEVAVLNVNVNAPRVGILYTR